MDSADGPALRIGVMLTLLMSVLWACGSQEIAPDPTDEEIEVITEALLLEGVLQDFSGNLRDSLSEVYYTELYDRYGIDADYLNDLRVRYSRNLVRWERLSDSVVVRLERYRGDPDSLLHGGILR